ncbi:hypothetical protein [Niveispirillum sp.]|uniref:hypothetical protein n=1 Tax=Niveispirillum sp. TaxID=1917217 RepID=UPI001B6AFE47|nr:hypothetical protein [Niveispirillum sp.]MBP7335889.1 hypothetical protein [Niveispirillum sp.]
MTREPNAPKLSPHQRLAHLLAHLLSSPSGGGAGVVHPWRIQKSLMDYLCGKGRRLLRLPDGADFDTRADRADLYLRMVLHTPIRLTRGRHPSTGHKALELLCQRVDRAHWDEAVVTPHHGGARALDPELRRIGEAFGLLPRSSHPMAEPFGLNVRKMSAPITDWIGLWDVISCGPTALLPWSSNGKTAFIDVAGDAMQNLDRTFRELVRLGVDPAAYFHRIGSRRVDPPEIEPPEGWLASLSQLRAANNLRRIAFDKATRHGEPKDSLTIWQQVWDDLAKDPKTDGNPVPGYKSLEAFLHGELGKLSIGHLRPDRTVSYDVLAATIPTEEQADAAGDAPDWLDRSGPANDRYADDDEEGEDGHNPETEETGRQRGEAGGGTLSLEKMIEQAQKARDEGRIDKVEHKALLFILNGTPQKDYTSKIKGLSSRIEADGAIGLDQWLHRLIVKFRQLPANTAAPSTDGED